MCVEEMMVERDEYKSAIGDAMEVAEAADIRANQYFQEVEVLKREQESGVSSGGHDLKANKKQLGLCNVYMYIFLFNNLYEIRK
jgi:hypothetical protein